MTFSEKLDRAKIGSKAAYESLCLPLVDSLYAAALLALKNTSAAVNAVTSAVSDGYAGISRIRDERHLRSWLVHELTKHIVDKLKEFKTNGTANAAEGEFAAADRLSDVERLVFAVAVCFGYGTREISVLTGMSEDAVSDRLFSAKSRLGDLYDKIGSAAKKTSAPENLKDRYRTFDESVARLERSSAFAVPEETPVQQEEPIKQEVPVHQEKPVQEDPPLPESAAVIPASAGEIIHETAATAVGNESIADKQAEADNGDEESVFADENSESEPLPAGQSAAEMFDEDNDDDKKGPALNAETFIAVVSAEKMKGSEFLRLIGNTRISNSVYREIEQNPRLTKKRLIALLEESPLNETDYYKLLTAVKHRRELLNQKEENRLLRERAGLFDGAQRVPTRKRRRREPPKTELQIALEMDLPKKEIPLTIDEKGILDDEFDYEIKNPPERHTRSKGEYSRREDTQDRGPDLDAIVTEASRESEEKKEDEPFHPSVMQGIFNTSRDVEAVDPLAAIYAKETGEQAKPMRKDEQNEKWIEDARRQGEERARSVNNNTGTQEFEIKTPEIRISYDTKQFDAVHNKPEEHKLEFSDLPYDHEPHDSNSINYDLIDSDTRLSLKKDKPDNTTEDKEISAVTEKAPVSAFSDEQEDEDISTVPLAATSEMSVTQIISHVSGEAEKHSAERGKASVEPARINTYSEPDYLPTQEDEGDEITTIPLGKRSGMSVTQIISDYPDKRGPDEPKLRTSPGVSDVTAIIGEFASPDRSGFRPNVTESYFDTTELENADYEEMSKEMYTRPSDGSMDDDDEEYEDDEEGTFDVRRTSGKRGNDISFDDENDGKKEEDAGYDEPDEPRQRYKGSEYFPDDDEYYDGVNRGKLIFCAVCALLLIAGAVAMKYFFKSDAKVPTADSGTAPVSQEVNESAPVTDEAVQPADDSQIITRLTEYEAAQPGQVSALTSQYLRASGEPYAPFLSENVIQNGNMLYIYSGDKISAAALDPEDPKVIAETALIMREESMSGISGNDLYTGFEGFTFYKGRLYVVTQLFNAAGGENDAIDVYVDIYTPDLVKESSYYIAGKFSGMGIVGGKPVVLTYLSNYGLHPESGEPVMLPAASGASIEGPSDIIKLNGAHTNGFAVIGEVGGSGFTVISGCAMCYAKFDGENSFTLLAADDSQTFAVEVNSDLEAVSARRFAGRAFSEDCINGDCFIGADTASGGVTAVIGKNALTTGVEGETPYAVAWSEDGKTAFVLAKQESGSVMLYGFDMSGESPASADVDAENIYSEKLKTADGKLLGLRAEASADGERSGLRLSEYEYSGTLSELSYGIIGIDENSPEENLKYLRSPAESSPEYIAYDPGTGIIAVPTIYFDGFSEVERIAVLDSSLSQTGEILMYDEKSSVLCTAISGNTLFIVTDTHIIAANASDCSDQKAFDR